MSRNSTERCLAMNFSFHVFSLWARVSLPFFLSDWSCSWQDAVGACLFASLVFYLSDHTVYVRLCCFKVPLICYALLVFLSSNACTQMSFCRDCLLSLVVSAWWRVCCAGKAWVTQLNLCQVLHFLCSVSSWNITKCINCVLLDSPNQNKDRGQLCRNW